MSYYMGDFYQGDPGFFSALGGIFRRVGGVAAGLLPGGGAVTSLARIGAGALARRGATAGALARRAGGAIVAHPVISAAAGAGVIGAGATLSRVASPSARAAMRIPGMPGRGAVIPGMRRRRRMNPYNPKALRRAVRRAHSFARMARHVLRFVSPKPPRGRALFRVHRKKRA